MANNNKKGKNNRRRNRKAGSSKPLEFFRPGPVVQYADFAYAATKPLTEGAASGGQVYVWSLNSIFDPDFSGVGTTALGYTAYSSFFTRYRVVSVRVVVNAAPSTAGNTMAGVMYGPNSTIGASSQYWPVQTNSVGKLINGSTPGGAHGMFTFDRVLALHKLLGVTKSQHMTDMDYSGAFGSNPAKGAYLITWMFGASGIAATTLFDVRLIYRVELSQPYQAVTN